MEEGKIVKLGEKVTVYATKKSRTRKEGEKFEVHPLIAEKLINTGKAAKTAPKGSK
jgi:hypothetical protein